MGFFMQPWVLVVLALAVTLFVVRWRLANTQAPLDSLDVVATKPKAARSSSAKSESKTTYRCRSCPQHFEPPHLFYVCPVCRSPVDKYVDGVAVDEVNPAFPKLSLASRQGTLPFIRKDDGDKQVARAVQKAQRSSSGDNVVALNTRALTSLQKTCWLVVSAESSSLAQTLADQSPNFRVLYRKKPRRLSKNRWMVWGKARSAA